MKKEIIVDRVTYIRKSFEIGDIYKFCNMDWYIIGKNGNKIKLMLKNVIKSMKYSDDNSNDYRESNVKKYLENKFLNKIDKSKLIKMGTNYDEGKSIFTLVRIPTLREIETLPMSIRNCRNDYWTMTSSYGVSEDCSSARVFYVYSDGRLRNTNVNWAEPGVRPVIEIEV